MALGKASKELHPGKTLCISHMPDFTLQQFGNAFNSYTKSFNGWENRKGRLFIESLKRCNVKDDKYFLQLVHYIHANPVQHGICDSIESWKHSSYPGLISNTRTFLKRKELLDWFGGLEGFVEYHQQIQPPGFEEPPGLSDLPTM